eukprot:2206697-Prymnesium_polylepis.1
MRPPTGVRQRLGQRFGAETSHNSSIQAARNPSRARDFADGARLSQSCSRLPRTVQRQQVFSALFVDERC